MIENPFGLRAAGPDDAEALAAFVIPIFQENAAQPISVPKITELVERCTQRDAALAGIVTGPDGIEGSVGMTVDAFDYSDARHVMVRWLGISPSMRRTNLGSRLISYVRWFHAQTGDVPVFLSSLTTTDLRPKLLMLQRQVPLVGQLFALGCLPDRVFLTPGQVSAGRGKRGGSGNQPHVRTPEVTAA
jgi:hypothetical protein